MDIGDNFDQQIKCISRYESHCHVTAIGDMQEVTDVLAKRKLFHVINGRCHYKFATISNSL